MEAHDTDILELLDGNKQFAVPIFQRRYNWEKKHCEKLWNDILNLGKGNTDQSHFLGSIVYIDPKVSNTSKVRELQVIDGQQRLTTLTLLLAALSRSIAGQDLDIDITSEELSDYYLNVRRNDELRYKQLLTRHDKDTLIQLLNGDNQEWFQITNQDEKGTLIQLVEDEKLPASAAPRLVENYRFFEAKLKEADLKSVYAGIQRLRVVDVVLDRPDDNPQLIFESLNSTGRELSQTDLIRNYVLMGQKPDFQNRLYKVYWLPMEQRFGDQYTDSFDRFIRDYLTLETRQIPKVDSVYERFKAYVQERMNSEALETIEPIIADISRYSNHYVRIALGEEEDIELQNCIADINTLEATVAFPFLLETYEDYTRGCIGKLELIEILRLVESYVFRRTICEIPTNSLNTTFATRLMPKVNKNNYLESLKETFLNLSDQSYRYRYPSDSEFKQEFLVKGIYNNHKRCQYLLYKLENYENKQPLHCIEDYTIEHIMPQNPDPSDEWKKELGKNWQEVQEKYLHTIGNLTLTGYNPELSDHSFSEKKEHEPGGFRDSRLRLNDSLLQVQKWNEDAILERAKELAEKALKIWIYPEPKGILLDFASIRS
jgi:uncharacterized protein with ParB-like and HNH nuclease domain